MLCASNFSSLNVSTCSVNDVISEHIIIILLCIVSDKGLSSMVVYYLVSWFHDDEYAATIIIVHTPLTTRAGVSIA